MRQKLIVLPLLVLSWGVTAAAQQKAVDTLQVSLDRGTLGSNDCGKNFIMTIQARIVGQPATNLDPSGWSIAVTSKNGACTEGNFIDVTPQPDSATPGNFTATLRGRDIFAAAVGQDCPTPDVEHTAKVCAIWENDDESVIFASADVAIDTTAPDRPRITKIEPGNRALRVSFAPAESGDVGSWSVCYQSLGPATDDDILGQFEAYQVGAGGTLAGTGGTLGAGGTLGGTGGTLGAGGTGGVGGDFGFGGAGGDIGVGGAGGEGGSGGPVDFFPDVCTKNLSGTKRSHRIENLVNGNLYLVAVQAVDSKGNVSEFSEPRRGIPMPTDGFWERYKQAGGDEPGGCSTSVGVWPWAWVGVFLFALLRRRGR